MQPEETHNIQGSLRGNGLIPPQGVSEAPRGELDSPLEVFRLRDKISPGDNETEHLEAA
jgi:hypothetical protein